MLYSSCLFYWIYELCWNYASILVNLEKGKSDYAKRTLNDDECLFKRVLCSFLYYYCDSFLGF